MRRPLSFLLGIPAAIAVAGIALGSVAAEGELPAQPAYGGTAIKTITGTLIGADGKESGAVQLSQDSAGVVQVRVNATGLKAGEHGIHIHATGKCEGPAFTSAGGHFNPAGKKHGLLSPDGHHNGDLHGLIAGANGTVVYTVTTKDISLTAGASNIFDADGTAIVIHADPDDHKTDATGNSGARVACAVIAEANPALVTPVASPAAPRPPATGTGLSTEGRSLAWLFVTLGAGMAAGGVALTLGKKR